MGPLKGVTVVEVAGIGPGPFCAMLLADLGADVVRIDRTVASGLSFGEPRLDLLNRGKRSIALDLKQPAGIATALTLIAKADVLIEGFRPGVMERLGLGPDTCFARNPKLIYGRMTGYGQTGPLAQAAGHDINYIALSGALGSIGRAGEAPVIPLNLVGDFGGGAMMLALGIVSALLETQRSGQGQIIDASMVEGASTLMTMFHGMKKAGVWNSPRGENLLDGGAPFYDSYQTKDGGWVAIGPLEPQFFAELVRLAGIDLEQYGEQFDVERWPSQRTVLTALFKERTRDEWVSLMNGSDVCFTPVLSMTEAIDHPHAVARGSFITIDGVTQPAPTPRFSRTENEVLRRPPEPGEHTREVLRSFGLSDAEVTALLETGAARAQ